MRTPLPTLRCDARWPNQSWLRRAATGALRDWTGNPSNLVVIHGPSGAGKSWLLRWFMEVIPAFDGHGRSVIGNFDQLYLDIERARFPLPPSSNPTPPAYVLLDNFDSVNSITGEQVFAPDLAHVARLFAAGHRVALATRRSPDDASDELNRQLASTMRWDSLGVANPLVLHLQPWTHRELASFRQQVATERQGLAAAFTYLRDQGELLSDDFRRPLAIKMLAALSRRLGDNDAPGTIAELYDSYASWVLTLDYDTRRSAFREAHKRSILESVAYDIFSGQPGTAASRYAISEGRLAARVLETVGREASLRLLKRDETYEWLQDFLMSNHLFEANVDQPPDQDREYQFVHLSFFEYFVAQAIIHKLAVDSSLGIRPEALGEAPFRSMILYFIRACWTPSLEAGVGAVATRRLAWPDRLLLLYTMETAEEFGELLQRVDPTYLDEITIAERSVHSEFVRKMIRYQLVVVGRYSPFEYVRQLKTRETPLETAEERRLLYRGERDLTQALLRRLDSPALRAAMPIAIFRLGQMGSELAGARLREIADSASYSSKTRQLARDAIEQILARDQEASFAQTERCSDG